MAVLGVLRGFLVLPVLICSLQIYAHAQTPDPDAGNADAGNTENTTESSPDLASMQELVGQGGDNLGLRYDDMPQEFVGARRSPLTFAKERGRNRFPSLSTFSIEVGMNPNSYERTNAVDSMSLNPPLDLSVDDEIEQASIATNRSIEQLQTEFLSSEEARDRHFAIADSVRGIALMTLSYLDKTVAAGIATAQNQADMESVQRLLKQLNQNMAKVANPQRRRVFDDLDEKFEACMSGEADNIWVGSPQWKSKYPADVRKMTFDPWAQCEAFRGADPNAMCGKHFVSKGRYHFCSCCVEKVNFAAMSTSGDDINWNIPNWNKQQGINLYGEGYSLVDRLFLGRNVPIGELRERTQIPGTTSTSSQAAGKYNAGILLYDFSALVRALYGDVIYTREKQARQGNQVNPRKFVHRFVSPLLSVPQWVTAIRETERARQVHPYSVALSYNPGNSNIQERGWWENHEGMWLRYAAALGSSLEFGVCPALEKLIDLEKANVLDDYLRNEATGAIPPSPNGGTTRTASEYVTDLWSEASIGGVALTVADLRSIVAMEGTKQGNRFIQAFCDASAVEGFKRLHRRVNATALDFLAANTKVPNEEKEQVRQMIARVTSYLDFATQDSRSQVDQMLLALKSVHDRITEAERSGLVISTAAAEDRARILGDVMEPWGGAFPGRLRGRNGATGTGNRVP